MSAVTWSPFRRPRRCWRPRVARLPAPASPPCRADATARRNGSAASDPCRPADPHARGGRGLCVAFALNAWAGRGTAAGVGAPGHAITVQAGQTLSQIALPNCLDCLWMRPSRIQLANAMSSTAVRAGAVLTIPGR